MPRLVAKVPSYRKHKQSGQAIVTLNGRDHLLGPHGSQTSRDKYDRLIAEWLARGRRSAIAADEGLLIAQLTARYWEFCQVRHSRNGNPTPELGKARTALSYIVRHYADHYAEEFGPLQLKVVRQSMVDAGWARSYVNQETAILVRMFKWAVTEGLIPAAVHAALDLVDGLRRGESAARETPKIRPVDDAVVEATLPHLSPTVRAMIELQRATGARPGEICILRPCDIDRSGDVWTYVPADHKTAHLDRDLLIHIGPKGQSVLLPFLLRDSESYCFSPQESAEWHRRERFAKRVPPENQGNTIGTNRKRSPKRAPLDRYEVASYRRAIHLACDDAFPAPEPFGATTK